MGSFFASFSEMRRNSAIGHIPNISSPQEGRHKQIIISSAFLLQMRTRHDYSEAPATNHQRLRHMLSLYPGAAGKRTRVDRKIFADDGTLYQYKDALSSLFLFFIVGFVSGHETRARAGLQIIISFVSTL